MCPDAEKQMGRQAGVVGAQGCVSSPEALSVGLVGTTGNAGKLAVVSAQMRLTRSCQAHRRFDRAAS